MGWPAPAKAPPYPVVLRKVFGDALCPIARSVQTQWSVRMPRSSSQASKSPNMPAFSNRRIIHSAPKRVLRASPAPREPSPLPVQVFGSECITTSAPAHQRVGQRPVVATVDPPQGWHLASWAIRASAAISVHQSIARAFRSDHLVIPGPDGFDIGVPDHPAATKIHMQAPVTTDIYQPVSHAAAKYIRWRK